MRAFSACVQFLVLHHLRGPMLLVSLLLFSMSLSAIPEVGIAGSAHRVRSACGSSLGVGHLVLLITAVVLPLVSVRWAARSRFGAARGPAFVQAASLLAHGLFLIALALCLIPVTRGILAVRHPDRSRQGGTPVVRGVLDRGTAFEIGPSSREVILDMEVDGLGAVRPEVRIRMDPHVVLLRDSKAAPQGLRFPVKVSWRLSAGQAWHALPVVIFARRRAEVTRFLLPPGNESSQLQVSLQVLRPGYRLVFDEGDLMLLGGRTSMVWSLVRGFLTLALGAWSLMACCLWLSRFCSYPIAIAASLTAVLSAAFLEIDLLPGLPSSDPARLMASGQAVGWDDLGDSGLKALLWTAFVVLLPFRDRRMEGAA